MLDSVFSWNSAVTAIALGYGKILNVFRGCFHAKASLIGNVKSPASVGLFYLRKRVPIARWKGYFCTLRCTTLVSSD